MSLGTVIATEFGPTPTLFQFVISLEEARRIAETGLFIQVKNDDGHITLGVIQNLRRTNRYFSSPDVIHGTSTNFKPPQLFPSEKWDYLIAECKVLGTFENNLNSRSTKPVTPGSEVTLTDSMLLRRFLGLDISQGIQLGKIKQMDLDVQINLDRLLQKHLAILSISGGGKSYTTSVLIEELLKRPKNIGRPAIVLFDVHGEYSQLTELSRLKEFKHAEVNLIRADSIKINASMLSSRDFATLQPSMSHAQQRELSAIISELKHKKQKITIGAIKNLLISKEINQMVKEALVGWLTVLENSNLFSYYESPNLQEEVVPGSLTIIDLSPIISLWSKQVIVYYFLNRIFNLRRVKDIPPVITLIEEAHQFCPEQTTSPTKKIIETIAREGRKFLTSLVLISQRPVNLSTTALSQCNSHLIMRILNPHDLNYIAKTSEGITTETLQTITSLGVGEGLLAGNATNYPIFLQIREKMLQTNYDEVSMAKASERYELLLQEAT